jgi:hypothetical protein
MFLHYPCTPLSITTPDNQAYAVISTFKIPPLILSHISIARHIKFWMKNVREHSEELGVNGCVVLIRFLQEKKCDVVNKIKFAHDKGHWSAPVSTELVRVPYNSGSVLIREATIMCSRSSLPHVMSH